ncbi:hypothetical protein BGX38DRAFT_1161943 [Terfezia claveryi]|nr:hypothetical protein BGX38DRAFT_1161943 [Terfezia claveryi]
MPFSAVSPPSPILCQPLQSNAPSLRVTMLHRGESQGDHHVHNMIQSNNTTASHTTPFPIIAPDSFNMVPWPVFDLGVQSQSNTDYIQILATCIKDRILETEHIACTQDAMEENNPGRIRDLESLVNGYSKATLALGGIPWPDINHLTFNLRSEVKLQKLQGIQKDFALLSAFAQRLLTFSERNRIYNDFESENYSASSSSIPSIASCSPVDSYPAIRVNPFNFQHPPPPTGCYTSTYQEAFRMNFPEPGLTDGNISFRSIPAKYSEDLNYSKAMSAFTRCATERVCPSILGENSQLEAGARCFEFPDLQAGNIDISTSDCRTTGSSEYMPSVLERSSAMSKEQGRELSSYDISFRGPLVKPLDSYQDNIMFSSSSYQRTATSTLRNEDMNDNGSGDAQKGLGNYSIVEPPDLPHFDGSGAQSAPAIENASDYHHHQDRSSVTHHSNPYTHNCHTNRGNDLAQGRRQAGQRQSQNSLRRYLCPISSCSRNRANSKKVLRSDNLGDHLRKVHKLWIPARTRVVSWVLTNSSLLRDVDEKTQKLHGGSLL